MHAHSEASIAIYKKACPIRLRRVLSKVYGPPVLAIFLSRGLAATVADVSIVKSNAESRL